MREISKSSSLSELYVKIIMSVVILCTFFAGLCALFFSILSGPEWIEVLAKSGIDKAGLDHVINQYSNATNYVGTQRVFWGLFVIGGVCSFLIMRHRRTMRKLIYDNIPSFTFLFKSFLFPFSGSPFQQRMANLTFLIVIGLLSLGLLFYPLSVDELSAFLFFVDRGPLVAMTYYPSPNNHVLFDMVVSVITIFTDSAFVVMKVGALIIAGVVLRCTQLIFILWFKALNGSVMFIFLGLNFNIAYYSVHGRGYMLIVGLALILLFSFWKIIVLGERKWAFVSVIVIVFGLYTIPVFVYPILAVGVWAGGVALMKKDFDNLRLLIAMVLCGCWLAGVLYVPILLFNGVEALVGNHWVQRLSWDTVMSNYASYFLEFNNWIWDVAIGGTVISLLLIGAIAYFKRRDKLVLFTMTVAVIVPLVVVYFQQVLPFYRVWICWLIPLTIGFGLLVNIIKRPKIAMWLIVPLLVANYVRGIYRVKESGDLSVYNGTEEMIDQMNFKAGPVFSEDDTYAIYCRYGFYLDGRSFPEMDLGKFESPEGYQTLILEQPIPGLIEDFSLVYSNENVGVFERVIPWTAP